MKTTTAELLVKLLDKDGEDVSLHFEWPHASVNASNQYSLASGRRMVKLEVMVIDQYRYQREWTLQFRHRSGNSKDLHWESHIYQHPGRREVSEPTPKEAVKLLKRFLELTIEYPTLLFNDSSTDRARCEGFVHFAEILHRGATPSSKLL